MNDDALAQVLIVGAGPTGLTLACDLARRGVTFRIIDKAPTYFVGSRGKALQPRTLEVMDDLGVIGEVLASGTKLPRLRVYVWRFKLHPYLERHREPTPDVPYPNTWLIPQWRTEEILRGRLAQHGLRVELATEITALAQDEDGVTATVVRDGAPEPIRAKYLVGADGGHSFVRDTLRIGFAGKTYETFRMLVGDVRVDGLTREHWHVWPKAKGGIFMLCPLPGTDTFQLQAELPAAGRVPELTETALQAFLAEAIGSRFGLQLRDQSWMSLYRPNVRMVSRYRVGRIFLAGDAAHVHPPTGGLGLNTGVQDAYNLGWKLGEVLAGAPATLLDTYEEERWPIAASVLGISANLFRRTFGNRFARLTSLRNFQRADTRQLGLHYRGLSLARGAHDSRARVRSGDRAPDAPCFDVRGAPGRLFDAFRGPHFTLLAFGARHAGRVAEVNARYGSTVRAYTIVGRGEAGGEHTLVDFGGRARAGYDVHGDGFILIRPDGYIGSIARPGNLREFDDYLGSLTATPRRREKA